MRGAAECCFGFSLMKLQLTRYTNPHAESWRCYRNCAPNAHASTSRSMLIQEPLLHHCFLRKKRTSFHHVPWHFLIRRQPTPQHGQLRKIAHLAKPTHMIVLRTLSEDIHDLSSPYEHLTHRGPMPVGIILYSTSFVSRFPPRIERYLLV